MLPAQRLEPDSRSIMMLESESPHCLVAAPSKFLRSPSKLSILTHTTVRRTDEPQPSEALAGCSRTCFFAAACLIPGRPERSFNDHPGDLSCPLSFISLKNLLFAGGKKTHHWLTGITKPQKLLSGSTALVNPGQPQGTLKLETSCRYMSTKQY